jgi:hypothetical protein
LATDWNSLLWTSFGDWAGAVGKIHNPALVSQEGVSPDQKEGKICYRHYHLYKGRRRSPEDADAGETKNREK